MHTIDIIFILFCIYVPILTAIYLVEVWIIVRKNSKFRGPFYALFCASAFCDLLFIIISFPEFRWAIYPIANGNGMVGDVFSLIRIYLSFVCPPTQDFLNCFIALNRLTAISLPIKNDNIWKRLLPITIIFSYIFNLVFFIPLLFRRSCFSPVPMDEYAIYLGSAVSEVSSLFDWFSAQFFCVVLELIINFVTLAIYVRSSFVMRRTKIKKQDRKLLIFGVSVFAVNIPGLTLQSLMGSNVFARSILPILYYNLAWVTDVKCFAAPTTMLIVNDTFRREVARTIMFWKSFTSTPVSSMEAKSASTRP